MAVLMALGSPLDQVSIARAQSLDSDEFEQHIKAPFDDHQLAQISDRQHPGYEPVGISVGGIVFAPKLTIDSTYVSNSLGILKGAADQQVTISPGFVMRSRLAEDGNEILVAANSSHVLHVRNKLEDHSDYKIDAIFRSRIAQNYSAELRLTRGGFSEERTSVFAQPDSLRPIQYDLTTGKLTMRKIRGRLIAHANIDVRKYEYQDGVSRSDSSRLLRDSIRSRTEYRPRLGLEYAFNEYSKLFGHFEYSWKQYLRPAGHGIPVRNSRGPKLVLGVGFRPTPVIGIEVSLGYLNRRHDNAALNSSGISGNISVEWLPTRLTSFQASLSRELATGRLQDIRDDFVTKAVLKAEHELRRNIVLGTSIGFQRFDFGGLEQSSVRWTAGATARYRANRNLSFLAISQLLDQQSSDPIRGRNFTQLKMSIAASLAI